jgi:DNA invertase Pin-like site-specific DNA recombinase
VARTIVYCRVSLDKQAEKGVSLDAQKAKAKAYDLGKLVERYFGTGKWALLSVSEQIDTRSAAGRLVLNVLASVSQWEREAIGERTSAALKHKAAQGEYIGGDVPYGYRLAADGERLEPHPRNKHSWPRQGGCVGRACR